jgi:glycosyltransferase involved in cell wall biosynthesis
MEPLPVEPTAFAEKAPRPRRDPSKVLKGPIRVKGKFFFLRDEKFFLKGVTYGPFAPSKDGSQFPVPPMVEKDFGLMAEMGANCLRTFTVPPLWLLDLAAEHGLRVLVGIPWTQHVCFLESSTLKAKIRRAISEGVKACDEHPAVFAYLIGNEIPPDVVRWHGAKQMRAFLLELMDEAKQVDPEALISYANFPSTEYLITDFTDFVCFNVYLHRESDFRRYLSRLHNLSGDRPLVLTEFGIDSLREGEKGQAEILSWQVKASFEMGVAGTVVFSWTDEWFTGGYDVQEWAFGLVDRRRQPKPAFYAVQDHYLKPLPPELPAYPKVSVVVCAFNAERTIRSCLASLEHLNYPNYEVIVIDDGSTDKTPEIAQSFPYIRYIRQKNMGLSVARNAGIEAAQGEIVAFTDSDCVPDPDWLTYMVAKFLSTGLSAVGGPNYPPPEEKLIPACVAASPGGPTVVLISDEVAEHIAGCNMAFRKEVLQEIQGFDPLFRVAADDVDLCWRLQNKGYTIGYSPAALVWHFRRNTIRAYLKQQRGYGKAEALVYFKHPYRFNLLGQARWLGRIYGDLSSLILARRPVIYHGVFGRGLFQTLYEPPSSLLNYLPLTLEWNLLAAVLLGYTIWLGGSAWMFGAVPFAFTLAWCVRTALKADIDPRFRGVRAFLLVALLVYLGPILRSLTRYYWRIHGLTEVGRVEYERSMEKPKVSWLDRSFSLRYWTESGIEKEVFLQEVMDFLVPRKFFVMQDQGWNDWDLMVFRGIWSIARIKVCSENHGGNKRLLRVGCSLRMSRLALGALAAYPLFAALAAVLGAPDVAYFGLAAGGVHAAAILSQNFRLGRIIYHVLDIVAKKLHLSPVQTEDTTVD